MVSETLPCSNIVGWFGFKLIMKESFGFISNFDVNFVEIAYKLVSRQETVQIKWEK